MRIAYFVNQYPKVSHTFIRREILALEAQGLSIVRYALRGWDADLADAKDIEERDRTRYVLRGGLAGLALSPIVSLVSSPIGLIRALFLALRTSRRSNRTLLHHLVSVAEAAVIAQWARRDRVRHIHAHFGTNSAEVMMYASLMGGCTYSFTVHGPDEWDSPRELHLREKIKRASFVVAISQYTRAQGLRWADPGDHNKIHVVHCGIDDAYLDTPPVHAGTSNTIVCVGRLTETKGQVLLIRALARLKHQNVGARLVLVGDGESREALHAEARRLGVEEEVEITGWASEAEVQRRLLSARVLALPSFAEGLPVVIMEAMAMERPVISTYIAGIPELVRNGEEGWLVPAGSLDALTESLAEALHMDSKQLSVMGKRARERVSQRHRISTEAAKLRKLFDTTLSS